MFAGLSPDKIKMGYVPSTEDKKKKYFNTKVQYYGHYGLQNIMFIDLYSEFDPLKVKELLSCDIIHLSAGNPIQLRSAIKNRKMENALWDYFNQGGTIIGVSGGAVQLGKSAKLFQLFTGNHNNEDLDTLNFVDFDFLPHYNRWNEDFKQDVFKFSQTTGTTIYAGNDGEGLIVEDGTIKRIGNVVKVRDGNIC
ncbi:dipeptidase E [Peribacillus deserti]|uniref:Dipeptidase E n=2 Tax=Peribacillus deserti TaxID=673318 RepID=A0ABS2QGH6_9BACI|nr:dipeptidase E [Peribacillus deserti]